MGVHDWYFWLLLWRSQDQNWGRDQLVICSIEPQSGRKKSIDSNRQKYESVCKPRGVCDGCIPQDAQNIMEPVWQLVYEKCSYIFFTISFDLYTINFLFPPPAPIAQLVECPLWGTGGHGFDPGPRPTKVVKNGTSCSSLGTQTYGVELGLVDPVSG